MFKVLREAKAENLIRRKACTTLLHELVETLAPFSEATDLTQGESVNKFSRLAGLFPVL